MEYITDNGAAEMDQTQNGEIIVGPQPDPNVLVQDAEMEEDEARSEATFRFTVHSFSKLKVSKTFQRLFHLSMTPKVTCIIFVFIYTHNSFRICYS